MAKATKEQLRRLISLWEGVRLDKGMWLLHWEDLARHMLPRRIGFVTDWVDGSRRTEDLYDATAMRAARGLSNAVSQLLRPEGEKWVLMRAEDDQLNSLDEVQTWLNLSEEVLLSSMYNPKARFRQASGESDQDLVVFGTACFFTGTARAGRHLQYLTTHMKDVTIALNADGVVDTVFIQKKYTLRQAIQKWGKESLAPEIQQRLKTDPGNEDMKEQKYEFLRVVRPRTDAPVDGLLSRNMPFADIWIDIANVHAVAEGGFQEFPFAIPRWDTSSGEMYGRSPGMIALPDAETLNAMTETILISGQKAADPSIFAPNDSSFDAINSFSGGITYYDVETAQQVRGNPFFTIDQNFNLPITRDIQADTREQVEAAFFKNIFNLPVNGPEMTATEVLVRKEEFVREIGPVFGRLESDYLAPIVERSFSILLRMGAFPPVPEILQGKNIRFEYTSPVNKIREQAQVAASRLWLEELIQLSAIDQKVMDIPNVDNIARFAAQAMDLPVGAVNPEAQVEAKRKEDEKEAQDQIQREKVAQEMQIAQTGGKAVKDIAEVMAPQQAVTETEAA